MGQRALDFCKAHPDSNPEFMATVARLEAALARAKELELQERLGVQEKIDQEPKH